MKDGEYDVLVLGDSYAGHLAAIEAGRRGFRVFHHLGNSTGDYLRDADLEKELFRRRVLALSDGSAPGDAAKKLNELQNLNRQEMARLQETLQSLDKKYGIVSSHGELSWESENTFLFKDGKNKAPIKGRGIIMAPALAGEASDCKLLTMDGPPAACTVAGSTFEQLEAAACLERIGFQVSWSEAENRIKQLDPFFGERIHYSQRDKVSTSMTMNTPEPKPFHFELGGISDLPKRCADFHRDNYLESRLSSVFIVGAPELERRTVERMSVEARLAVHNLALQLNQLVHTVGEVKSLPYLHVEIQSFPKVYWTQPPCASVGYGVEEARARGFVITTKTVIHPELFIGRPWLLDAGSAIQFITDEETGCLHGVAVVSRHAEEIVQYYRSRISISSESLETMERDVAITGLI